MAADGMGLNVEGLDKLFSNLIKFAPELQKKGMSAAARKGANVIRDAARLNAKAIDDPTSTENIEKNITAQSSARLGRSIGGVAMRIGVMGGARSYADSKENRRKQRAGKSYSTGGSKGAPGGDTWYWRLHEFGSEKTKQRPLLRDAATKNAQNAIDAIAVELSKQIQKLEIR